MYVYDSVVSMLAVVWPPFPGVSPRLYPVVWVGMAVVAALLIAWFVRWWYVGKAKKAPPSVDLADGSSSLPSSPVVPVQEDISAPETIEPAPPVRHLDPLRLKSGLKQTRLGFVSKLSALLRRKKMDSVMMEQLEEVLLTADVGVQTAQFLFDRVRENLSRSELADGDAVFQMLKDESRKLLDFPVHALQIEAHQPFVILVLGVNGVGKTTTIGKLAAQFKQDGKKVLLAAGDTFRAAAVEQLSVWGNRVGVDVVRGKEGADPSAVIFNAIKEAQQSKLDLVIADTAGRLHVKTQLMEELQKVRRVIQKAQPTAPHETWLVLDATTGQNAIAQARAFKQMMDITGIVLTKLDGTAKGGVILGICHELQLPVRYIGIGEKTEDLQLFDSDAFIEALYEDVSLS